MIYLDSRILIYLVERTPKLSELIERLMTQPPPRRYAISPLVRLECLVGPLRAGHTSRVEAFQRVFGQFIELPITREVFDSATKLRADGALKTPDAIHLATARRGKCTELWTNDDRLAKAAPGFAVNLKSHLRDW